MIKVKLGEPNKFNPENVDYLELDNYLRVDSIEKAVRVKVENIDETINIIFGDKDNEKVYENVFVDNENCEVDYSLTYEVMNGESIHIAIKELGDTYNFNIKVKNKNLIEYKVVEDNKPKTYSKSIDKTGSLDYSLDVYEFLKFLFK